MTSCQIIIPCFIQSVTEKKLDRFFFLLILLSGNCNDSVLQFTLFSLCWVWRA